MTNELENIVIEDFIVEPKTEIAPAGAGMSPIPGTIIGIIVVAAVAL